MSSGCPRISAAISSGVRRILSSRSLLEVIGSFILSEGSFASHRACLISAPFHRTTGERKGHFLDVFTQPRLSLPPLSRHVLARLRQAVRGRACVVIPSKLFYRGGPRRGGPRGGAPRQRVADAGESRGWLEWRASAAGRSRP